MCLYLSCIPVLLSQLGRDSRAVVQLRAIVLKTNQVIAVAQGVGGASLLHVPMVVNVPKVVKEGGTEESSGEVDDGSSEAPQTSPVVVEATIDETQCDIPVALRSVRPYHYPAGQEGDLPASYLSWSLTTVTGGYGVQLSRDRTIEDREALTRQTWEDRQIGRNERATSKRARYKTLLEESAVKEKQSSENPETKEEGLETEEKGEEEAAATTADGLGGMEEEEIRIATERRSRMNALPPITVRSHVVIGGLKNTSKTSKGKSNTHYVAKPGQYLDGVVSTSNDEATNGAATRSQLKSDMLVERGRRRLTSERQLRSLKQMRTQKMKRVAEMARQREVLLFPKPEGGGDADE